MATAGKAFGIKSESLVGNSKERKASAVRALACKWMVEDLRMTTVAVAGILKVASSTVSRNVPRGREIADERSLRLGRMK